MMQYPLTPRLVETRTRCSNYQQVINLNAWGSDITDISVCAEMPLLEVLSLSQNKIHSLLPLRSCTKLKALYLRCNKVGSIDELRHLKNATDLTILWFQDNPCSIELGSEYRTKVLSILPQIKRLDDVEVLPEEREAAEQLKSGEKTSTNHPKTATAWPSTHGHPITASCSSNSSISGDGQQTTGESTRRIENSSNIQLVVSQSNLASKLRLLQDLHASKTNVQQHNTNIGNNNSNGITNSRSDGGVAVVRSTQVGENVSEALREHSSNLNLLITVLFIIQKLDPPELEILRLAIEGYLSNRQ